MTDTFVVMAKRWAHGWELHIKGVGVTQVGTLSRAEAVAREYIALAHDIDDEKSFDVDVVPQLDATLAAQVRAARAQVREAERQQREAAAKQREVARRLGESGLSGREIAAVLGMTPQRVSQLIGKSAGSGVTAKRSSAAHTSRAARGATGHRSKARGAK